MATDANLNLIGSTSNLVKKISIWSRQKLPFFNSAHNHTESSALDGKDAELNAPEDRTYPTVWFNPWMYEGSEQVWAGLADAIIRAIKAFDSLPAMMNVGLGYDYTIDEYYKVVAEVLGYGGDFSYDLSKPVGMARKLVNTERQQAWGWVASHDLREGIKKAVDFYFEEHLP